MNNMKKNKKIKIFNMDNKLKNKPSLYNDNEKKLIESYNYKTNNKKIYYSNKKINLETSTTSEKNNNLSLFSFLSYNTNQEEKLNKSLRTTKETESNIIINKKQKFSENTKKKLKLNKRNKIKVKPKSKKVLRKNYNTNINNINHKNNKININKDLDKFKSRIENLLKVITNFENNYINSPQPKIIKEELNKIMNKNYLKNDNNSKSKNNLNLILDKESSGVLKKCSLFNSMNNINIKRQKKIMIKKIESNNSILNTYSRRIKYSLLLNENSNKKIKTKRIIKEKSENNNKNNNIHHFNCKSSNLIKKKIQKISNKEKNKFKEKDKIIKTKNIYLNSNFDTASKINDIKRKVK